MTEAEEMFEILLDQLKEDKFTASGTFPENTVNVKCSYTKSPFGFYKRIFIWPESGGAIILEPDGTWSADVAPGH